MSDDQCRTTNVGRQTNAGPSRISPAGSTRRINPRGSSAPYSPPESYTNCSHEDGPSLDSRLNDAPPRFSTKDARLTTLDFKKKPRISAGLVIATYIYLPVPVRFEDCGLLLALSVTFNFPVLVPTAVGVNTTLMVQLVLAARLAVQVVVETLKSPVVEITMLLSATLWLFLSVNVFGRLVVPTVWAA